MEWTKTNIHHAMRMYDSLQNHMFSTFMYWWEDQNGQLKSDTPEWDEFWKGMDTLNDNSFFDYDWQSKEWIIRKGDKEYRFPQNWPYQNLNEEPDLDMIWHSGYYDGPLSGMALYNGKYVWFDCFSDDWDEPYPNMRVYKLYELSEEEIADELYWHSEFEKYVGYHTNYDSSYAPFGGKNRKDVNKFYKKHKKRKERNYTSNAVLGEFTDVQFRRNRPLSPKQEEGIISNE